MDREGPISRRRFSLGVVGGAASVTAVGAGKVRAVEALPPDGDLAAQTMTQAAALLRARRVSSVELVKACLEKIATRGADANAFITVTQERALEDSRRLDDEAAGRRFRSPLHGIPIALKDNIDTAGVRTTAASAIFADRTPDEDAEVVRRLRAAGAVIIGKTNLGELAFEATAAQSHFGAVRNPRALDRITGGSSGGNGAALAADCCYGTLGTDSGGSVRIPAAYCGVVGFKPTYGLVSMRGIMSSSRSFDTCGPMARSVEDAAVLLDVVAGYDPFYAASVEQPAARYRAATRNPVSRLRVGVARDFFFEGLDPEIGRSMELALRLIERLTGGMRDVVLPSVGRLAELEPPEYLAYHHGLQRLGYVEQYRRFRPGLLAEKRAYDLATCHEKLDSYIDGRWALDLLRRTSRLALADLDVVVAPTMKSLPPTIEDALKHGPSGPTWRPLWENTRPFNIYGWPAISLPCGTSTAGLPIGIMIAGPQFSEAKLFALAHAFEREAAWRT